MKNLLFCIFIFSLSLSAMESGNNIDSLHRKMQEVSVDKKCDLVTAGVTACIGVMTGFQTALHVCCGQYDYAAASSALSVSSLWIAKKLIESYRANAQHEENLRVELSRAHKKRYFLKKEE